MVAERLVSLAILATASDYLQPSEMCAHMHTHDRAQTRALHTGCCHGYIKAETANFDQLLTVMSETVEMQRNGGETRCFPHFRF